MEQLLPVVVSDELRRTLPDLRVHGMVFDGAKISVGHAGLDPLRRRVVTRLDELIEKHKDLADIPTVLAFMALIEAGGDDPHRNPPKLLRDLRAMTARQPFPVVNDAHDCAFLLSLYYLVPVFLLDAGAVRPPLVFLPSPEQFVIPTPEGPLQAPGVPVLTDDEKVLRSIQYDVRRAPVIEPTKRFLMLLMDPGVDGGLDPKRTVERVDNWVSTLTGARLVECSD